ncbi:MAG: hypothetical protein OHK0012_28410 [Synechococcales cyanobacterium]
MKKSTRLIATAVVAMGSWFSNGLSAAQAETLFWNGENGGFCVIQVSNAGLLTPDANLSTLSSQNSGGNAVNFVVTTNDRSTLDDQFPNQLAAYPNGFNPSNAVMTGALALSGSTAAREAQQQATTLNVGATNGVYHMTLATADGTPLQAGAYQVKKEITCTPAFQRTVAQNPGSSSNTPTQPTPNASPVPQ